MLRALDRYLVSRWPNLWALKLPTLLVPMAALSLIAFVVALLTPVELDNIPDIGSTYTLWLLLSLVPFGYWMASILRVAHPPQRRGGAWRGLLFIGPIFACLSSLAPVVIYVSTLEQRIGDVVESVEGEIRLYAELMAFYKSPLSEPFVLEGEETRACWLAFRSFNTRLDMFLDVDPKIVNPQVIPQANEGVRRMGAWYRAECTMMPELWGPELKTESAFRFDEVRPGKVRVVFSQSLIERAWSPDAMANFEDEVRAQTQATSRAWGSPWATRLSSEDPVRLRSYAVALHVVNQGFDASQLYFPYRKMLHLCLVLGLVAYIAHALHFARYGSATMLGVGAVAYGVLIGTAWALGTIKGSLVRVVPLTNYAIVLGAPFVFLFHKQLGKRAFLFELWLCSVPLLGLSVVLWEDPGSADPDMLMRYTAMGCWAALALVPGLHLIAERYRSLPA